MTSYQDTESFDDNDFEENDVSKSNIQVVVRKRPLNTREVDNNEIDIIDVSSKEDRVTVYEPKTKVDLTKYTQQHDFIFDSVFDETAQNQDIYRKCVKPLLRRIFQTRGKATCFGYGQTGSGKTYTLLGSEDAKTQGLYIMAVYDIFEFLKRPEYAKIEVICSFYEIYGGKLFDLLAGRKQILAREDGKQKVNIVGLTKKTCRDAEQLMSVIQQGSNARSSGMTGANDNSSRSHAILSIDLQIKKVASAMDKINRKKMHRPEKSLNKPTLHGRISFIDLAGSERGADTANNDKQTRIEGAAINQSLLALKECIRALDQNHSHKPFRGSKLTQVLKESFVGNSKTVMIANISPNNKSCENTLNTLRYANRVKELKSSASNKNGNAAYPKSDKSLSRNRSEPTLNQAKANSRPLTAMKSRARNRNDSIKSSRGRAKSPSVSSKKQSPRQRRETQSPGPPRSNRRRSKSRKKANAMDIESDSVVNPRQSHPPSYPYSKQRIPKPPKHPRLQNQDADLLDAQSSEKSNESSPPSPTRAPVQTHKFDVHTQPPISPEKESEVSHKHSNAPLESVSTKHLVRMHRKHIDEFMILIKDDMSLLKDFDKGEFSREEYVSKLNQLLQKQIDAIKLFRSNFRG